VEKQIQKQAAGATKTEKKDIATAKGKLVEFAWHMKKQGYSHLTIEKYIEYLKILMNRGANLFDPESVKEVMAQQQTWSKSTKCTVVAAYNAFTSFNGIIWNPPRYEFERKLPFIPLESEIDALIANSNKKMATLLQLLKETGIRIGEALRLKWINVDLENNTITVNTPEKRSNPRMLKISNKLAAMLNRLPRKEERVFPVTYNTVERNLNYLRKRTATKLQNPRLLHITFHTLRHWKATMEYHQTKDILHVMQMLGHKNIQNTLLYTQLITFESDEYHVRVATTLEEDKELIEAGFEYVTERNGVKIYRKRK
jgi:integrase